MTEVFPNSLPTLNPKKQLFQSHSASEVNFKLKRRSSIEKKNNKERNLEFEKLLLNRGHVFKKYGRTGNPHIRRVFVSDDLHYICWSKCPFSSVGDFSTPTSKNYLSTNSIIDISRGCNSDIFLRNFNINSKFSFKFYLKKKVKDDKDKDVPNTEIDSSLNDRCFSIIFTERTLDLEAINKQDRDEWVLRFEWLLEYMNNKMISSPSDFKHILSIDENFQWSGEIDKQIQLVKVLGSGSFGDVWLGYHISKFELAIKMISFQNAGDVNSIRNEIEVLKKCRHKNIVSYYGTWGPDSKGKLWILMDYCAGGSLALLLRTRVRMSEPQIAFIIISLIKALIYLHERNIIHRDVKSSNVLLTKNGEIMLADFGIAATFSASITKPKEIAGSPLWMAPEIVKSNCATPASDIWSLGITALELAEGRPPHCEKNTFQVLATIIRNPPPKLAEPTRWSDDFNNFVASCLIKDPLGRPKASQLITHPFLLKYIGLKSDILNDFILKASNELSRAPSHQNENSFSTHNTSSAAVSITSLDPKANNTHPNDSEASSVFSDNNQNKHPSQTLDNPSGTFVDLSSENSIPLPTVHHKLKFGAKLEQLDGSSISLSDSEFETVDDSQIISPILGLIESYSEQTFSSYLEVQKMLNQIKLSDPYFVHRVSSLDGFFSTLHDQLDTLFNTIPFSASHIRIPDIDEMKDQKVIPKKRDDSNKYFPPLFWIFMLIYFVVFFLFWNQSLNFDFLNFDFSNE